MPVEFRFGPPPAGPASRRGGDDPLRILVVGDFSGGGGARDPLPDRRVPAVDVDVFDDVMARLAPRLDLPLAQGTGRTMPVAFAGLEDFHPDALYDRLPLFQALQDMRRRLADPATFADAAAELRRGELPDPAAAEGRVADDRPAEESDETMLDRLLGERPVGPALSREARRAASRPEVTAVIGRIVAPYIEPAAGPQQAQLISSVDTAIGDRMRAVLHDPGFQALEAAWRSLHGLVTGLETGEDLKLFLLDASRDELAADIDAAGEDLSGSALHRLLLEGGAGSPGGQPWSLIVGDFGFGPSAGDVGLLAALGAIAARAGGPFVAAAKPAALGCASFADAPDPVDWAPPDAHAEAQWRALRRSPAASWIGVAAPRVLLRLPYGRRTDEVDRFAFEEMSGAGDHESYLWGNAAFACARLIGLAFRRSGWAMQPGEMADIGDLPAYTYDDDGERVMKACGEAYLSDRAAEAMMDRGVMAVLSHRNRNAVRIVRFQSVADPPRALSGPWS